jgi:hypothetical protein
LPAVVPAEPPAPIETKAVAPGVNPVTAVDLEKAPPPLPAAEVPLKLPPPPPITSILTKDAKSEGIVKVVPEEMVTRLTGIIYSNRN